VRVSSSEHPKNTKAEKARITIIVRIFSPVFIKNFSGENYFPIVTDVSQKLKLFINKNF
jgi:hypothetical protein